MTEHDTSRLREELHDFKSETNRRLTSLETSAAVNAVHQTNVENRLHAIEDNTKWLIRLVSGAVILAIVGYVIGGGLNLG